MSQPAGSESEHDLLSEKPGAFLTPEVLRSAMDQAWNAPWIKPDEDWAGFGFDRRNEESAS